MVPTSSMRGTLDKTVRPSVKRQAAMQFEGRVLGSARPHRPRSGPLGRTSIVSTAQVSLLAHPRLSDRHDPRTMVWSVATAPQAPDRNLAMELVRITEAAAMAASRWMGRGDKSGADGAAVEAMRVVLSSVQMDGVVVIGEGEKDNAPMLFNGERIGDGSPPQTDIAVDPIDGTTPTALGRGGALAVIAVSERGTMFDPGPCVYMEKLAVGPRAKGACDIRRSADGEPACPRRGPRPPGARPHRGHPRSTTPRRPHRRGACHRSPDSLDHRRGRGRGHRHRVAGDRHRHPLRDRRHPRGRAGRRGAQVHRWGDPRDGSSPGTRRSEPPPLPPATSSTPCSRPMTSFRATTASSPQRASPTGSSSKECASTSSAPPPSSLVMRSKSGTLRKIDANHALAKLSEFSSISFS